jgi:hypothetical protein
MARDLGSQPVVGLVESCLGTVPGVILDLTEVVAVVVGGISDTLS